MNNKAEPHHQSPAERYEDFDWTPPARLEELARDETLWAHFLQTAVHFDSANLKGCVRPVAERGEDGPPIGPLHVITAVQPGGDPGSDESAARIRLLKRQLENDGLDFFCAVGSSFDGSYREESIAIVGLDDARAREIGRRYGQVAVFAWHGPTWSLLACVSDRQLHRPWRWQQHFGD